MASNYPDNMDWAAFDAAYGPGLEFSDDTLTAAAMVYYANACGMDWAEADAWLDDCLLADEPRYAKDDDRWLESARDHLRHKFHNKPKVAAKQIDEYVHCYMAKRERDAAKRAVIRFIASLGMVTA